ncbi:MAG: hypothetical protein IPL45_00270 [Actinomycetales bacterium]|nr:hypothetical protein [Actinomycetales bacterium]
MLRSTTTAAVELDGPQYGSALPEAERILSLGIIIIRLGVLAQVISGTVRGFDLSDNPTLYLAMAGVVTIESLLLIAVLWHAKRPHLWPWGLIDVGLGFAIMVSLPWALPENVMSDSWIWWGASLAINTVGNFGATQTSWWWVGAISIAMSGLYVVIGTTYGNLGFHRSITESLTYPTFGFGLLLVSRYLRSMATRADADRRAAVEAMRHSEMNRARLVVHDASTLLRLLGDPSTPAAILPALQNQARQESAQIRTFLSEPLGDRALLPESLGEIISSVTTGFSDLPMEFATDLGADALIYRQHAPAVARALTTVLHNVRRHAQATQVVIHADQEDERWEVTVRDDGVGFDEREHPHGFGLASQVIGELTRLGLHVAIASAPGHGTAVTIAGPCAKEGDKP